MIVGPHSTKLPQSWDTGSHQPSVPAISTTVLQCFVHGNRPSQELVRRQIGLPIFRTVFAI